MKRIREIFEKFSRRRVMVLYGVLILAATGALFYFYYVKSSDVLEREVTRSILQTLKQTEINLSNRLNKAQIISESVFSSPEVMLFVGDENNTDIALQVKQQREIISFFNGLLKGEDSMQIRLFISGKKLCSAERVTFFPVSEISQNPLYQNTVKEHGQLFWTGVYLKKNIGEKDRNVISCARVLKHTYDYRDNHGILLVDIEESSLYSILSSGAQKGETLFIVDKNGRAVSCGDKLMLGRRVFSDDENSRMTGTFGIAPIMKNQKKMDLIYQTIDATGWKIVAEIERDELVRPNMIFSGTFSLLFVISMFLIIVLGIFFFVLHTMLDLNRQVRNFAINIRKQDSRILDKIGKGSAENLTSIENYFYSMMRKVKTLMDENYRSKIRERDAQLMALQAQINPHFLYNTLDMINWMAFSIGAREISSAITELSKYFRISLSKGKSVITVGEELELAKTYLSIQKTRFMGAIQYQFEIDEETKTYSIPKLTLQPILENAVVHGIQKKESRRGNILIRSKKIGSDIYFWIRDDGVGMEQETIDRIFHSPAEKSRTSYGLFNVNERLGLMYGKGYGLRIRSQVGSYTEVEVKIKAVP